MIAAIAGARRRIAPVRLAGRAVSLVVGAAVMAGAAAAQQPQPLPTASMLDERLDAPTRHAVQLIIDSAAQSDLPVAPLVDKALEGAAKRASSQRIIGAVRMLATDLRAARHALGAGAGDAAFTAGVAALRSGIAPGQLHELGNTPRPPGLARPLSVLTDLVTRGVPTDTAVDVILGLIRDGTSDVAFSRFAAEVLRDIAAGVPPAAAAAVRAGVNARPAGVGRGGRPAVTPPHGPPAARTPVRPIPPRRHPGR